MSLLQLGLMYLAKSKYLLGFTQLLPQTSSQRHFLFRPLQSKSFLHFFKHFLSLMSSGFRGHSLSSRYGWCSTSFSALFPAGNKGGKTLRLWQDVSVAHYTIFNSFARKITSSVLFVQFVNGENIIYKNVLTFATSQNDIGKIFS